MGFISTSFFFPAGTDEARRREVVDAVDALTWVQREPRRRVETRLQGSDEAVRDLPAAWASGKVTV